VTPEKGVPMNRITVAGAALLVLGLGEPKVARALVEVPTLTEMIEDSEAICFVEVREIQPWKKVGWWTYERIRVEVLEALKWSGAPAEEIVVVTRRFEGGMEDPPAQFPPVGGRALVFLHRNDEGDWVPTDSIYGLWEWSMEENMFQGAWSVPLEYLEQVVACLSDPATKTECMERLHQRPSENDLLPANGIGVGITGDDASADAEGDASESPDASERPGPSDAALPEVAPAATNATAAAIVPAPPLPATVPEAPAPAPRRGCGCSVPGEPHAAGGALGLTPLLLLSVPILVRRSRRSR
jgi:MYXO-CTERM domain-containing protein